MNTNKVDVIVVGGGPGGAVAAKKCAESGCKTILVEKRKLPRDKVCTGMIMGPWANNIVREAFGNIPLSKLSDPPYLSGHMIHVPGSPTQTVSYPTPIGWRKDLDYWMVQKAAGSGVDILEGTRVTYVAQNRDGCTLKVMDRNGEFSLESEFVIAADGGASTVRKSIFPDLKVTYSTPLRECYHGSLEIEKNFIHWVFPKSRPRPRFDIVHKDQYFVIEGSGLRVLGKQIRTFLAEHGFNPLKKPEWKDGCLMPLLHNELINGRFLLGKKNVLLVGDAAGFVFPVTFEGIGTALKSGILAAQTVVETVLTNKEAAPVYIENVTPMIKIIRDLMTLQEGLAPAADKGATALAEGLRLAYEATLNIG